MYEVLYNDYSTHDVCTSLKEAHDLAEKLSKYNRGSIYVMNGETGAIVCEFINRRGVITKRDHSEF